jgi:hypothetical protein
LSGCIGHGFPLVKVLHVLYYPWDGVNSYKDCSKWHLQGCLYLTHVDKGYAMITSGTRSCKRLGSSMLSIFIAHAQYAWVKGGFSLKL